MPMRFAFYAILAWTVSTSSVFAAKQDVRGVSLGMSLSQAKSALAGNGANCNEAPGKLVCVLQDGQDQSGIEVDFNSGGKAESIDYNFYLRTSADQLVSYLINEYNLRPSSRQGRYISKEKESVAVAIQFAGSRGRFLILDSDLMHAGDAAPAGRPKF